MSEKTNVWTFLIVGKDDKPLYETEWHVLPNSTLAPSSSSLAGGQLNIGGLLSPRDSAQYLNQFFLHSALDVVDELLWKNNATYLKIVETFKDHVVSAYITPGGVRFLMLHDSRNEDTLRTFFAEVHELYLKVLMNPFYELNSPITSPIFDSRVKTLGQKLKS